MPCVFASTTYLGVAGIDVAAAIEPLRDLALDGIELGSTHTYRPDIGAVVRSLWPGRLVTHNYFPPAEADMVINLASLNDAHRAASLHHAEHCLRVAADLGAELYTVHPGFLAEAKTAVASGNQSGGYDFQFSERRERHDVAFNHMIASLEMLLATAQSLGIRLAIESEGSLTKPGVLLMERPEEYERLFEHFPDGLWINFNLAHSRFAARAHAFDLDGFLTRFSRRIAAVELSHNDGQHDQHQPLVPGSFVLDWLPRLPDVSLILEFRDSIPADIARSAELVRAARSLS